MPGTFVSAFDGALSGHLKAMPLLERRTHIFLNIQTEILMVLRGLYENCLTFSQKESMHTAGIQKDEELTSAELHF